MQIVLNSPTVYRIKVEGHVPPDYSDRMMGTNISAAKSGDANVSVIVGRLPDQPAKLNSTDLPEADRQ